MKKIVSILILSLLPILAWAEGDYYDFSKLRKLKGVESVYVPSNMAKAMKGAMAQQANVDPMATMNIETLSTVLVLSTENKSSLREFRKTLDALRKKRGYQVLLDRMIDDEQTYIITHPKAGSATECDEMIVFHLEADEGKIVQLIGTLVAPGK